MEQRGIIDHSFFPWDEGNLEEGPSIDLGAGPLYFFPWRNVGICIPLGKGRLAFRISGAHKSTYNDPGGSDFSAKAGGFSLRESLFWSRLSSLSAGLSYIFNGRWIHTELEGRYSKFTRRRLCLVIWENRGGRGRRRVKCVRSVKTNV